MLRMSPRRWRVLIWAALSLGVLSTALLLKLVFDGYHEYQRSKIAEEIRLAQPFLALSDDAYLELGYKSFDPNGLRGYGHAIVHYETADPQGLVTRIQDVMIAEDWSMQGHDLEWRTTDGCHCWGNIFVKDQAVEVFIGVIEG